METGRFFWVIRVGFKRYYVCFDRRKVEGDFILDRREGDYMIRRVEIVVMRL